MNKKTSTALWLTVVCFNFYMFTRFAFEAAPHSFMQAVWFVLVGLWARLAYREIRKVTSNGQ